MYAKKYVFLLLFPFIISGCATILKGYYDKVTIINPPEDLKIETSEGLTVPYLHDHTVSYQKWIPDTLVKDKVEYKQVSYVDKFYTIDLRSNQVHTLQLKSADFEKTIVLYPKMGAGWLLLDTVTGIFPIFFDMYTGCFNYFDDINFDLQ
jgi:hypothetical protein